MADVSAQERTPRHLVIVCGHGIWLGGSKKGYDEKEWLIESYKAGETPTFIKHIEEGLKVLKKDPKSVVIFSGGRTRSETRLSEARSYANLAAANSYFNMLPGVDDDRTTHYLPHPLSPIPLHPRVLLEERALDSYYNVLFSIIEFWRHYDYRAWPYKITIVSHGFKRARIIDCHCMAMAFYRATYIGYNPPNLPAELTERIDRRDGDKPSRKKVEAMRDVQLVAGQWEKDPHGVGHVLAGKRKTRNVWHQCQKLFYTEAERKKSGVKSVMIDDEMEALAGDPDEKRPWS